MAVLSLGAFHHPRQKDDEALRARRDGLNRLESRSRFDQTREPVMNSKKSSSACSTPAQQTKAPAPPATRPSSRTCRSSNASPTSRNSHAKRAPSTRRRTNSSTRAAARHPSTIRTQTNRNNSHAFDTAPNPSVRPAPSLFPLHHSRHPSPHANSRPASKKRSGKLAQQTGHHRSRHRRFAFPGLINFPRLAIPEKWASAISSASRSSAQESTRRNDRYRVFARALIGGGWAAHFLRHLRHCISFSTRASLRRSGSI